MRRVAEIADGWLPFEQPAEMAAVTTTPALAADQLGERVEQLRRMRAERGRPTAFDVCFSPRTGGAAERLADTLAAALPAYERAGATHVSIESHAGGIDECLREIEILGKALAGTR